VTSPEAGLKLGDGETYAPPATKGARRPRTGAGRSEAMSRRPRGVGYRRSSRHRPRLAVAARGP
jgi:hypothetical protein